MIQVTRKDQAEANENIIRRFNRRVLQSGLVAKAKSKQRFEKPESRRARREGAIVRNRRKDEKALQMRLGLGGR